MQSVVYLSVDDILEIHRRVIVEFGGELGLRDRGLLESAAAIPAASFAGSELHPGVIEKAAAYHFHLCSNHAFLDGNKRVAVVAAELFLLLNGLELIAEDSVVEELTIGVAERRNSKEQVISFFLEHVSKPVDESQ